MTCVTSAEAKIYLRYNGKLDSIEPDESYSYNEFVLSYKKSDESTFSDRTSATLLWAQPEAIQNVDDRPIGKLKDLEKDYALKSIV